MIPEEYVSEARKVTLEKSKLITESHLENQAKNEEE